MRFQARLLVAAVTFATLLYVPAARAQVDAARAQIDAALARGAAARERYFTDMEAVRAAEAQGNAPAAAVLGPVAEREWEALRAARTEAIELVRKLYVDAGGHSLVDPSIAGGDVVVPDAANPGPARFVTRHVAWQPRYAFARRWSKRSDVDEGPRFAITAAGDVLLYEKLFEQPASEIAAALLHESVHFESFITRRLCVRGGPTEAAADEDEVRALDAEIEQAGALGLEPVYVDLRRLARSSIAAAGAGRRAERGDAEARRDVEAFQLKRKESLAALAADVTRTLASAGPAMAPQERRRLEETKRFAESDSGPLPDGAAVRDAAPIDPAQCAAPSALSPPPQPTPPDQKGPKEPAGVATRHRFFLDLMGGAVLGVWAHDWPDNTDLTPRARVAFGIEAGFRILPRLAILLTVQGHTRGGYMLPSPGGGPLQPVWGLELNTGAGLEYELPVWVPARGLASHVPRLSLAFRMLVGYTASLTFGGQYPVEHGFFALPEIGLRYQVSDRLHLAVYPVSVPFIFNDIETSVSWRFMGLVGVDL